MPDSSIIDPDLVLLDVDAGTDKGSVIGRLARRLAESGRATDSDGLIGSVMAREGQSATGLPGGIAIPHCRSPHVLAASIGFARLTPKVDFGAPDGPADLVFMIAAPESGGAEHMKLLSNLARALVRPDFVESLRSAASPDDVVGLVDGAVNPGAPATTGAAATPAPEPKSLVAVTACPTGIAHTYMAADALSAAAKRAGVTLAVETQGSSGSTPLSPATIAGAGAVIFATDVGVKDRERFAGKPVVAAGVKRAINEPDAMIAEAVSAAGEPGAARVRAKLGEGWGTRIRQILLTGVSYMIPFVAAGGLLIALGFLLGGYQMASTPAGQSHTLGYLIASTNSLTDLPTGGLAQYLGAVLFELGTLAFAFLVPALAGYIAFAIADRPGIAPGFTAG
ncbi:MAG TPA: fructose PTS transporter subunit IIB, partial [Mycobacterium sp.]|nr:fructose PTS transporter subunit IIB [Mycobacterium sp.]